MIFYFKRQIYKISMKISKKSWTTWVSAIHFFFGYHLILIPEDNSSQSMKCILIIVSYLLVSLKVAISALHCSFFLLTHFLIFYYIPKYFYSLMISNYSSKLTLFQTASSFDQISALSLTGLNSRPLLVIPANATLCPLLAHFLLSLTPAFSKAIQSTTLPISKILAHTSHLLFPLNSM